MTEIVWRKVLIRTEYGGNFIQPQRGRPLPPTNNPQSNVAPVGRLPEHAYLWVQTSNENDDSHSLNEWRHILYDDFSNGVLDGWIERKSVTWYDTPELEAVARAQMALQALDTRLRVNPDHAKYNPKQVYRLFLTNASEPEQYLAWIQKELDELKELLRGKS
jgi:hypothetical protein